MNYEYDAYTILIKALKRLCKEYPNNEELGAKLRELMNRTKILKN